MSNAIPDVSTFEPHRLTLYGKAEDGTEYVAFDDVLRGVERPDPLTGDPAFIHEHNQLLEDLYAITGGKLRATWTRSLA